ncbi:toprim domain-containing protein [Nocardia yamanashiensis]|uniref:toprim domain-containing protein n=1 Tax=Nocardia yamanashiensis TaxID=209247 RepID=UPI00083253DB|nr:toprim domain-containing protein [Nocardia yamanashiensis]
MSAPAPDSASRARVRAGARGTDHNGESLEVVTAALEKAVGAGRESGAWTRYRCPVHEADGRHHNPSLIVKHLPDAGRTKVSCRAGCDDHAVLAQLGLTVRDLYDRPLTREPGQVRRPSRRPARQVGPAQKAIDAAGLPLMKPKKELGAQVSPWKTTAVYDYADTDGQVVGQIVRKEASFEAGRDKKFTQQHWNSQAGKFEPGGFASLPFRLPQIRDAISEGRWIAVCEGEKDVLAAESAGMVATTNAGGAGSWTAEHAEHLRGAHTVVIVVDRDAPGYRRAEKVMATLSGLVERVRVVQAATGKDLHDHFAAGHEVSELEPVPHLDPLTPPRAAASAPTTDTPAAEAENVSAAPSTPQKGTAMATGSLFRDDTQHTPHSDEVDHIGRQWAGAFQLALARLLEAAMKRKVRLEKDEEERKRLGEQKKRELEAEQNAKRAAAEAKLRKLRDAGWENCSREQIAAAVADAFEWSEDSQLAKQALTELKHHVQDRFGVAIDTTTGKVAAADPSAGPEVSAMLAEVEAERARAARLTRAQDHMVEMVAAEEGLDQSVREELYAEIERWRANPSPVRLSELTKKLADKGVGEATRTRIRYVASYLGVPDAAHSAEAGIEQTLQAAAELRKLGRALVDPGEEAKGRLDAALADFQAQLRRGADDPAVRRQLIDSRQQVNAMMAVLTQEDRKLAAERLAAIVANPAGRFRKLWPDHVDRDELAAQVRLLATVAPQADAAAVRAASHDDATAAAMRKQAGNARKAIAAAISDGKGLHQLEKDQLAAVLREVDAGRSRVPKLLFADDRSTAAAEKGQATQRAQTVMRVQRRQLEKLLDGPGSVPGTSARVRDQVTKVFDRQSALAAGRTRLADYEKSGAASELVSRLTAVPGVSAAIVHRVGAHLAMSAGEATSLGQQAKTVAEQWGQRMDAVTLERAPEVPAYDSPERRAALAAGLQAAGLDADQVAARMAADAGCANPASAATKRGPGEPRTTNPGEGVHRINHLRKNQGRDNGYGD